MFTAINLHLVCGFPSLRCLFKTTTRLYPVYYPIYSWLFLVINIHFAGFPYIFSLFWGIHLFWTPMMGRQPPFRIVDHQLSASNLIGNPLHQVVGHVPPSSYSNRMTFYTWMMVALTIDYP